MPQLDPSSFISQIFWLVLAFTVLYFFMSKFFVPRISQIVGSRENTVRSNLELAEKVVAEQKDIKNEIAKILEEARKTGSDIKNAAIKKAEITLNESMAKVESDISRSMVAEEQRLATFKVKMANEVEGIAKSLSTEIIGVLVDSKKKKGAVN